MPRFAIGLYCLLLMTSCVAQSDRKFPKPLGWVNDFDNLYSVAEKRSLDSLLTAFEKETTIEIALVTLRSDMLVADSVSIKNYALGMANEWGVGKKELNNGILIAISKSYRTMRINNGYGIESILTDEDTRQIIDTGFLAGFKSGNFYAGTFEGIQLLMTTLLAQMKQKNIHYKK